MSNIKISQLPELLTIDNSNTIFLVTDLTTGNSKFIRLGTFTPGSEYDYTKAQAAYNQANAAYSVGYSANIAFNKANSATALANAAFATTNTAFNSSNAVNVYATAGFNKANAAFNSSNSVSSFATASFNTANAAFNSSNAVSVYATAGFNTANTASAKAIAAFDSSNAVGVFAGAGFNKANNAVAKAGDAITGVITAPTAASGTSNTMLATTNFVATAITNALPTVYRSGMVMQTAYKRVDTKSTWSFPAGTSGGTFITDLNSPITLLYSSSKVLIQMCLTYEVHWDSVFRLYRSVGGVDTLIGVNANDANYWSGTWVPQVYDNNVLSTPQTSTFLYYDTPATASPITYKLMIQSSSTGTGIFYLNRSASSAGAAAYEVGISQTILQEIY